MRTRESIIARYFAQDAKVDETSVRDYREPFTAGLAKLDFNKFNNELTNEEMLDLIYGAVEVFKEEGLNFFLDASRYYVDYVENGIRKPAFSIGSGFLKVLKMKEDLISCYEESYDKDKYIEMLRFFRLISENVKIEDDELLDRITMQKVLYVDLKEININETRFLYPNTDVNEFAKYQDTFAQSLMSIMDNKAGIDVSFGKSYINNFGNNLKEVNVTLRGQRGDAQFKVYVPMMVKGGYTLGNNKFLQTKLYEDFLAGRSTNVLKIIIRSVVEQTLSLTKAYKISQENAETLRRNLQTKLNSLMFAKRVIKATKAQIKLKMEEERISYDEAIEKLELLQYEFSPFTVIGSKESTLKPFEILMEFYKFYFKEYINVTTSMGANIMKNLGGKGYEVYKNFPLSNINVDMFDPGYINNKANFAIAYLDDTKTSIIHANPFAVYNHQSFRNAASAYIVGHAFKTVQPHDPLTVGFVPRITPPSYNMWFAFLDYEDSTGLSTIEGQRLVHYSYADALELFEGVKIAYNGYDKGVSRVMKDEIYFVDPQGERVYVNMTSPLNIASRENLGVLYEGLYNGKKALEGKLDTEYRNFELNPLKEEELLNVQQLFKDTGEEVISLGYHYVGFMQSYLVRDIDSSYKNDDLEEMLTSGEPEFKKYKLGLEWFSRARLMGADQLIEDLLHVKTLDEDILKLLNDSSQKLFGKSGAVTERFQKEVKGFTSTSFANNKVPLGRAHAYMFANEFEAFLLDIKSIDRNFDIEKARNAFYSGIEVFLPPALQLRNPSVDDANTIYTDVYIYQVTSKYAKHGYIEVNPLMWARQGGDFDGDQVILLFFKWKHKKELQRLFGHHNHEFALIFEHKIRKFIEGDLYTGIAKEYNNIPEFLMYIGKMKKNEELGNKLKALHLKVQTRRQTVIAASSNLLTTRISKQLIGVAKTITMKGLFFIEDFAQTFNIKDLKLFKDLRTMADRMNDKLVQPTINIQKWSDNLQDVIKTVLLVYRMSEAVSAFIEYGFYPTYRTFNIIRDIALKNRIITKSLLLNTYGAYTAYIFTDNEDLTLNGCKFGYAYQEYLYSHINLRRFAEETKYGDLKMKHDITKAEWLAPSQPEKAIKNLIDVLNPEGEVFKKILEFTEKDMEGFDAAKLFYVA